MTKAIKLHDDHNSTKVNVQGHKEKVDSFIKKEELREAKKTDWKNLRATVKDKKSKKGERKESSRANEPRGTIDYITDRFAGGGESSSARKSSLRTIMAVNSGTDPCQPIPKTLIIVFYESNFRETDQNLHDPIIISVIAGNFIIKKVHVDQGSSADILFHSTFQKMQLTKASLTPSKGDLVGFSGEMVDIRGAMWLRTAFNSKSKVKIIDVQYLVINIPCPYHMILRRPSESRHVARQPERRPMVL
ncbi:hypothetical protein Cni_G29275 [Canna indica]|uniref:Uncharacterized protein n=1 Tax=Canna indica TaxID=4628 RepID=A0AAQ3L539_9LILI|nr:hypothetical protein Cni_G29275 [Canna indica]